MSKIICINIYTKDYLCTWSRYPSVSAFFALKLFRMSLCIEPLTTRPILNLSQDMPLDIHGELFLYSVLVRHNTLHIQMRGWPVALCNTLNCQSLGRGFKSWRFLDWFSVSPPTRQEVQHWFIQTVVMGLSMYQCYTLTFVKNHAIMFVWARVSHPDSLYL